MAVESKMCASCVLWLTLICTCRIRDLGRWRLPSKDVIRPFPFNLTKKESVELRKWTKVWVKQQKAKRIRRRNEVNECLSEGTKSTPTWCIHVYDKVGAIYPSGSPGSDLFFLVRLESLRNMTFVLGELGFIYRGVHYLQVDTLQGNLCHC